jgi:uncharacterized protein (TIGR00369 family)
MLNPEIILDSLSKQGLMQTIGVICTQVEDGQVTLECEYREGLSQQHGYFHAGVLTSIADSACGYAAYTKMPEGSNVLSVEFKVNFLKPAKANKIIATGKVIQAGRTLVICEGVVTDETRERVFARMLATMITVVDSRE